MRHEVGVLMFLMFVLGLMLAIGGVLWFVYRRIGELLRVALSFDIHSITSVFWTPSILASLGLFLLIVASVGLLFYMVSEAGRYVGGG